MEPPPWPVMLVFRTLGFIVKKQTLVNIYVTSVHLLRLYTELFRDSAYQNAGLMNNDIRHAMRILTSLFLMIAISVFNLKGQSPQGTLKIFSDNPLVVYVNETHYPQYGEITLVPGTYWVKAINGEGTRVFSQIVNVKANEVTSVLIEATQVRPVQSGNTATQNSAAQGQSVVYGQASAGSRPGQAEENSEAGPAAGNAPAETAVAAPPKPTIDIGQTGGRLPADMSGAFGLSFGMNARDVDQIMSPKAAQAQRNNGYYVYAIPMSSSFYLIECRFIDQRLFQIIVGYVSTYTNNEKLKLSKDQVPYPEFNRMLNDVTAIYGSPATAEKIFLSGYGENDGRLQEALRKKKALLLHTWIDPATGNNIMVGLGYTNAPLAATIYTSGPMSAEAASRKLRLHAYDYNRSFKDNYFSN